MKIISGILLALAARDKDCGGYIKVEWSPPNKKIQLDVSGNESTRAKFVWKEGGVEKHRGELALQGHYDARCFVSPVGNGFLVFCPNEANDLFAFYSAKGEKVSAYGWGLWNEKEREVHHIGCCGAVLSLDVKVEDDGWFVTAKTPVTGRAVRIFVPLGRVLDELLRAQLSALLDPPKFDVDALLKELDDDRAEVRERATLALKEKGIHSLDRLRKAASSASLDAKMRLESVIQALEPLKSVMPLAQDEAFRKAVLSAAGK
jgi:hypothetical protein